MLPNQIQWYPTKSCECGNGNDCECFGGDDSHGYYVDGDDDMSTTTATTTTTKTMIRLFGANVKMLRLQLYHALRHGVLVTL